MSQGHLVNFRSPGDFLGILTPLEIFRQIIDRLIYYLPTSLYSFPSSSGARLVAAFDKPRSQDRSEFLEAIISLAMEVRGNQERRTRTQMPWTSQIRTAAT